MTRGAEAESGSREPASPRIGVRETTARELAQSLAEAAADSGVKLARRPWNRFEPDETDWWVVPSPEWPAHRMAKLYLKWANREDQTLFLALHVEKGLGEEVREAYDAPKGRRLIMDGAWDWWEFTEGLAAGQFRRAILSLHDRGLAPLLLEIEGSYVADPDAFDPYVYDFALDRFRYEIGPNSDLLHGQASEAAGLLGGLAGARDLSELGAALRRLSSNPWIWVDLMMGVPTQLEAADSGAADLRDAGWIWDGFAQAFPRWLASAGETRL